MNWLAQYPYLTTTAILLLLLFFYWINRKLTGPHMSLKKAVELAKIVRLKKYNRLWVTDKREKLHLRNDDFSVIYTVEQTRDGIEEVLDFRGTNYSNGYIATFLEGEIVTVRNISSKLFPRKDRDEDALYELLEHVRTYL